MIVLIHVNMDLWDFIIDGVRSRDDVFDAPLDQYTSKVQALFRKVFPKGDYPPRLVLGKELRGRLQFLNKGDKVIIRLRLCLTL